MILIWLLLYIYIYIEWIHCLSDERIEFISGFKGSNGLGLITQEVALLWTDSRYYVKLERELYKCWNIRKIDINEDTLIEYIIKNLKTKSRVAMD